MARTAPSKVAVFTVTVAVAPLCTGCAAVAIAAAGAVLVDGMAKAAARPPAPRQSRPTVLLAEATSKQKRKHRFVPHRRPAGGLILSRDDDRYPKEAVRHGIRFRLRDTDDDGDADLDVSVGGRRIRKLRSFRPGQAEVLRIGPDRTLRVAMVTVDDDSESVLLALELHEEPARGIDQQKPPPIRMAKRSRWPMSTDSEGHEDEGSGRKSNRVPVIPSPPAPKPVRPAPHRFSPATKRSTTKPKSSTPIPKPSQPKPISPEEKAGQTLLAAVEHELERRFRATEERYRKLERSRVPTHLRQRRAVVVGVYAFRLAILDPDQRTPWEARGFENFRRAAAMGPVDVTKICPGGWSILAHIAWEKIKEEQKEKNK